MGLFSKFSKKETEKTVKSALLTVAEKRQLTPEAVLVTFDVPSEYSSSFKFEAGQYVNLTIMVDGKKEVRSYSICSGEGEQLSIGVKAVSKGKVSTQIVEQLQVGTAVEVSIPHGNFKLKEPAHHVVAFAAGSGITPIVSLAKKVSANNGKFTLFYGNKSNASIMFAPELSAIPNVSVRHFLSQEKAEGTTYGRLNKQLVSEAIKADLTLLRADHFYLCGPEDMIIDIQEVLTVFGIRKDQIHFELFTTPVHMKTEEVETTGFFEGKSEVSAILDGEVVRISLDTKGSTILEALDKTGLDVPYSCRGGVCCTCKAKIIEGSARMNVNYALTDEEVKEGYILACQSHPTSAVLKIDFDA